MKIEDVGLHGQALTSFSAPLCRLADRRGG
jgi:hypothetical protein